MTVHAFRTQSFQSTHENRAFDFLLQELKRVWERSDESVTVVGNFYCRNSEIDAVVLKHDAIIVIDFKDYGGRINFSENGPWLADGVQVKGGSRSNPFIQLRKNRFELMEFLDEPNLFARQRHLDSGHISALVMFHQPIVFDESQLPKGIDRWFHVVDLQHIAERIAQITSRQIALTDSDIEAIVTLLDVPEYIPTSERTAEAQPVGLSRGTSRPESSKSLEPDLLKIGDFLDSDERMLVIITMARSGRDQLLNVIANTADRRARSRLVLAPNGRLAENYPVNAQSIYSHVYQRNAHVGGNGLLVHDCAKNGDAPNQLYVIGDSHLVSDSYYELNERRFGTGQLLSDFLSFVDLDASQRKIIFVGDRYQLMRGKVEESALSSARLLARTKIEPMVLDLDLPTEPTEDDAFARNRHMLATGIQNGAFNQLEIATDSKQCLAAPEGEVGLSAVLGSWFAGSQNSSKFIAYSNDQVNRANEQIRREVFGRTGELCTGDIVHFHNGCWTIVENRDEASIFIPNDSFAEVIEVDDCVEPLVQLLRGRDQPVVVSFLNVRARIYPRGKDVRFLCLKDYLYAEKAEMDRDVLVALRVNAEWRFKQSQGVLDADGVEDKIDDMLGTTSAEQPDRNQKRAAFLNFDPYLNAARLRFGYALTLHRAQGNSFDRVITDLDAAQGRFNEAYFRWLYTVFTIPRDCLIFINAPVITPLSDAVWDESGAGLGIAKPQDLIPFDPDADDARSIPVPLQIEGKELCNLYWHIRGSLEPIGITITSVDHKSHQEIYYFRHGDGSTCSLRLDYGTKKGFKISKVDKIASKPDEFHKRVCLAISSGIRFETDIQRQIHASIKACLDTKNLTISAIEHHAFQEVYFVRSPDGEMKLDLHYNKGGFVTKIRPVVVYPSREILDVLRKAFEA